MDYYYYYSHLIIFLVFTFSINVYGTSNNFKVTDFGAIPDGQTDSSEAFATAWQEACQAAGGTVSVPKGTFFIGCADFDGPCNGTTQFQHDGILIASDEPTLDDRDFWISFSKVDDLKISGNGRLRRQWTLILVALPWYKRLQTTSPTTMKIAFVTNAFIQGVRFVNSKMFHIHIFDSDNVHIQNVNISAPADSPNTDGIHIGDSNNTWITDSYIGTGDDCVSIGEGSINVNITGVWCGPGHGISIGSLGKGYVEQTVSGITVRNCTFNGTDNGLRIKTWAPSSPCLVSDITFAEIVVNEVQNPIIIDQFYCPHLSCSHGGESSVEIKGVKFVKVQGSSASETSVSLQCSKSYPCQDIEFYGLNITHNGQPTNALCANADDKFVGSHQIPSSCSSSS